MQANIPSVLFFSPNYCKNLVTRFLVDEAAMVYMAYQCVGNQAYQDKQTAAIDYILKQQDDKGVFGNEYSTALALQVSIICRVFFFTIQLFITVKVLYRTCLSNTTGVLSER